jgi:hypothetical protein
MLVLALGKSISVVAQTQFQSEQRILTWLSKELFDSIDVGIRQRYAIQIIDFIEITLPALLSFMI